MYEGLMGIKVVVAPCARLVAAVAQRGGVTQTRLQEPRNGAPTLPDQPAMPATPQWTEIRFAEALSLDAREEVVIRLQHQTGVHSAVFDPNDPTRLRVQFDPGRFSTATLRDFIEGLWLEVRLAP